MVPLDCVSGICGYYGNGVDYQSLIEGARQAGISTRNNNSYNVLGITLFGDLGPWERGGEPEKCLYMGVVSVNPDGEYRDAHPVNWPLEFPSGMGNFVKRGYINKSFREPFSLSDEFKEWVIAKRYAMFNPDPLKRLAFVTGSVRYPLDYEVVTKTEGEKVSVSVQSLVQEGNAFLQNIIRGIFDLGFYDVLQKPKIT